MPAKTSAGGGAIPEQRPRGAAAYARNTVVRAARGWLDDNAASMGAAIAFYSLLSMAPLLMILIAITATFFGEDVARGALSGQLQAMFGDNGAQAVMALLAGSPPGGNVWSAILGGATLAVGATSVVAELQNSLDRIWRVPVQRISGVRSFVRRRLLTFALILASGFLLTVSLAVSTAIEIVGKLWGTQLAGDAAFMQTLNLGVGLAVITALFAMIYKILPSARIQWKDVWLGSALTSILFSIGKYLIGVYIGHAAVTSSYGAAGTLVAVILWVYYSAQIFLLGAEVTHEHGRRRAQRL